MDTFVEDTEVIEDNVSLTLCTPLSSYVTQTVTRYIEQLQGHEIIGLHTLVIAEVEKPLLQAVLAHSGQNQSKAAKVLGLSRSTLRKKMELYGIF